MKIDTSQSKPMVFQPAMDNKCIAIAVLKLLLVIISFSLPIIAIKDFASLTVLLILTGLWFTFDFLMQPQKILLYGDRIAFIGLIDTINLFHEHIRFVKPATIQHIRLLRRKIPGFQFWGKRGWFSSKVFENIFIYSLSYQIDDLVLIKYGTGYYLLTVKNPENFIETINHKLNN